MLTNAKKTLHPGKIIAGFIIGTKRLYRWVHDNPLIEFHPTEYVNDPFVIARNRRMVAINSAIEVDLTGQICADSIGPKLYSGVGGQLDFIYGASRSEGGVPIITLPSTAKGDEISRIVPMLKQGAGVVTSRNHVRYVITEYGIADLYGKTIRQRAQSLDQYRPPQIQRRVDRSSQGVALHLAMLSNRRTKIVATIGPATQDEVNLQKMIKAGMNVARLNFSHGTHEVHKETYDRLRKISHRMGVPVCIMQDLQGVKIRTGEIFMTIYPGETVTLTTATPMDDTHIFVDFPDMHRYLEPGKRILLDDGNLELVVKSVEGPGDQMQGDHRWRSPSPQRRQPAWDETRYPWVYRER